jgi:hypothetical protein
MKRPFNPQLTAKLSVFSRLQVLINQSSVLCGSASQASPVMNQDVEGLVDNARLCGAKVLQQIKVGPSVGPRATNSPSITVSLGRLCWAAAM